MDIGQLLIQLISGVVGGNVGGALNKAKNLGPMMNSILGAVGGIAGGQLLGGTATNLLGGSPTVGSISASAIVGLVLPLVAGLFKSKAG